MTGVELPGLDRLPSGPRRELTEALHELYEAAGRPGLRKIADAVREGEYRDTVSHEKVSAMLKGKDSPRWSKWECVVRQLAVWTSPRRDPEVEASLFLKLWQSADHPAGECAVYASTSASASQAPPHPPRSMSIPEQTSTLLTAAQQLAQHGVDQYERGRRDASDFAPHLDYPAYEELARADFDVRPGSLRGATGYRTSPSAVPRPAPGSRRGGRRQRSVWAHLPIPSDSTDPPSLHPIYT